MSGIGHGRKSPYRDMEDPEKVLRKKLQRSGRFIGCLLTLCSLLTFGWVMTIIRHERELGTPVDNSNVRGAQVRIVIDREQYRQRAQTGAGRTPYTWHGLECVAYCSHYGRGLPNCDQFTGVYCYLSTQASGCR